MPYYKFVGNIVLTCIQNFLLKTKLSEFHSGYRAYKVDCLKKILFELNSNDYCFDTEIIIQIILSKMKIKEIAVKLPIRKYGNSKMRMRHVIATVQLILKLWLIKSIN